jgi:hypothetical protein
MIPPDELLRMTPIGSWSFSMLEQLENEEVHKPTAIACLKWFNELSCVFLQDVAAMIYYHPEREQSALFRSMPRLQTPEFLAYKQVMAENNVH